jgi:hypothetical protein
MEIPEREFLWMGGFWMGIGLLVAMPWLGASWLGLLGRWVLVISAIVHVAEAFYARSLAERAGLDPEQWFWRSLVLGYLAVRKLHDRPDAPAAPRT